MKSRGVNTEDCEVLFDVQRETHGHDAMEFLTMKPTPERRFSVDGFARPVEGVTGTLFFQAALFREANFTESCDVDIES